jgi:uracil-DNA glycosylase
MKVKLESSWLKALEDQFEQPYFKDLTQFVRAEYLANPDAVFPPGPKIFNAFDSCPLDKVKVVVLGQDPYPTKGHAHGLCFSVQPEVRPLPKSLINIFTELKDDVGVVRHNGDLTSWADQGVLLLNSVLTVREGEPGSHANRGWELFTDAVINVLNQRRTNVVYVLWGSYAQQKAKHLNRDTNFIIESPHPSPLSAYRGFFSSRPFSRTNEYLIQNGLEPIIW